MTTPTHYDRPIQPIDLIEAWDLNFRLGNVIKYACRAGHKNDRLEDLQKAQWYLQREIDKEVVRVAAESGRDIGYKREQLSFD
jgi:hypothetical protein